MTLIGYFYMKTQPYLLTVYGFNRFTAFFSFLSDTVSFFYMDMSSQTKHLQYALKNVIVQMIDADEIWFRLQPNLT